MVKMFCCTLCLETKEASEFFRDKARKSGYTTRCKLCCKIRRYMPKNGYRGKDKEALKIMGKLKDDSNA